MSLKLRLRSIFLLGLISITYCSFGQLVVSDTLTAAQMAGVIEGQGIQILNPQITCAEGAFGSFNANVGNFQPEEGIILSTGFISNAIGPNDTESKSTAFPGNNGDPLLTTVSGFATNDACRFEFDLIPAGDSVIFDFSFASEEYSEYVGTNFNDVFGFFISGPGVIGDPGLGGRKNIALIPGTTDPVTINSVNGGNNTQTPPIPATNPQFYNDNPLNPLADIQYDGWTIDLIAVAGNLVPCDTFHLELVIADASDRLWDSGVFVEKIRSNNIVVETSTVGGTELMIEGCNDGFVSFTRDNVTSLPLDVQYFLQGTATNGSDYNAIGNPDPLVAKIITIPAFQGTAILPITTIDDGIPEGPEFINILVGNPICPGLILDSVKFWIKDSLDVFISANTQICAGETIDLSIDSGGTSFNWSPVGLDWVPNNMVAEPTVTINSTTTLSLTTSVASCTTTEDILIEVSDIQFTFDVTPVFCSGGSTGAIDLTLTGGFPSYDITWTGPGGPYNTEDINNLVAGTYNITVTDNSMCTASSSIEVTEIPPMQIDLSALEYNGAVNVSCNGVDDGQISAVVSGGTGGYTIEWDDPMMQTGPVASGLTAGTYTAMVTDSNGCMSSETITLIEPDLLTINIITANDANCFGESSGLIEGEGIGGVPDYNYEWQNDMNETVGTNAIVSNLIAGTYTLIVTDANNCTTQLDVTIGEPSDPLTLSIVSQTNVACFGENTGTVEVMGSGGTVTSPSDYSYSWDPPVSTAALAEDLIEGLYTVTVTDLNGCSASLPITITQPPPLTLTLLAINDINCLGQDCGFAVVQAGGGTPGYTFEWSDFQIGPAAQFCTPGTYTATVTDMNGCKEILDVNIGFASSEIRADFAITDVICGGDSTGAIDMTIMGGVAPYDILWTGGNCGLGPYTTEDLTNICAGEWCVSITDFNGCTLDTCITVNENPPLNYFFEMTPAECFGAFTGDIDFIPLGGVPPYTYSWYGPIIPPMPFDLNDTIATTEDLLDQPGGVYLVILVDDLGCDFQREITITAPDDLMIDTIAISDYNGFEVSCPDACDGFIDIDVTGGTTGTPGQYYYDWKEQQINYNFEGLGPGFQDVTDLCASEDTVGYEVIVVDDNQCLLNAFFIMDEPPEISVEFNVTDVSCSGFTDGTITATVTGGVPPFMVQWLDFNMDPIVGETNLTINNVGIGLYFLQIQDLNSCSGLDSVLVGTPNPLVISLNSPDFNGYEIACNGDNTGFIQSFILGGTMPFSLIWRDGPGGPIIATDVTSVSGLSAGEYCLTVVDANMCTDSTCLILTEPDALALAPVVNDVSCEGSTDGSIDLGLSGGVLPYSINWTDPIPDDETNPTGLSGGSYTAVIVDANGCDTTVTFEIQESPTLVIAATSPLMGNGFNIQCNGDCNGSIDLTITGGTFPFTIDWDNDGTGDNDDLPDLSGLCAGDYTVVVTDFNGCSETLTISLTEPPPITISIIELSSITCDGECDGQLQATGSGGVGVFQYVWDLGVLGNSIGPVTPGDLCEGTYTVTVTDENDCVLSMDYTINAPDPITITSTLCDYSGFGVSCNGSCDGCVDITPMGGTMPYTFQWTFNGILLGTGEDLNNICAGEYCVLIVDANGCTYSECFIITEPDELDISFDVFDYNGFGVTCFGVCDGIIDVSILGGAPPFTHMWSGPGGFTSVDEDIFALCAGEYILNTIDVNGCGRTDTVEVTSPDQIIINLSSPTFPGGTEISCVGDSTGTVIAEVSGGSPGYVYDWFQDGNPFSNDTVLISVPAGDYELIITDTNGCTEMSSITLGEPLLPLGAILDPTIFAGGFNISCFGVCDGGFDLTPINGTPGYTFNWRDETNNLDLGDSEDLMDLCAGIYSVVVTDTNECTFTLQDTLFEPPLMVLDTAITGEAFCFEDTVFTIDLSVTGGVPGYDYQWSGESNATTQDLMNVTGGSYSVVVSDANMCLDSLSIEIERPDSIVILTTITPLLCNGNQDGEIDITVSGGTGGFDFDWTGDIISMDEDITNLGEGIYIITVTDENNCMNTLSVPLIQPDSLTITASTTEGFCGSPNGSIDLMVTGGVGGYIFDWDSLPDIEDHTSVVAGIYNVIVTDANMCMGIAEIMVPGFETGLQVNNIGSNVSCFGFSDAILITDVLNGTPPFTYNWADFPDTGPTITGVGAGSYMVTITDDNNCDTTVTFNITEPDQLLIDLFSPIYYADVNISIHGGSDGAIETDIIGGSPEFIYNWTGPNGFISNEEDLSNLSAGNYCLMIIDQNNCEANTCIFVKDAPELELMNGMSPNGDGANDGLNVIGLEGYPINHLQVFNRWGNIVHEEVNYQNGTWLGEGSNGEILPDGTYFVIMIINDGEFELSGYLELRR